MLLLTAFSHLIAHPHRLFTSKPHPEEGNKWHEKTVGPYQPERQKATVKALYCCECEVAGVFLGSKFLHQCIFTSGTSKWSRPKWERKKSTVHKSNRRPNKCKTTFSLNSISSAPFELIVFSLRVWREKYRWKVSREEAVPPWCCDWSITPTVQQCSTNHVCNNLQIGLNGWNWWNMDGKSDSFRFLSVQFQWTRSKTIYQLIYIIMQQWQICQMNVQLC